MRRLFILAFLLSLIAAAQTVVKVSDFSPDALDATAAIQAALDSKAAKVIIDKLPFDYQITTVFLRSNQEVVFEKGVRLKAVEGAHKGLTDSLVVARDIHDAVIRGEGDVILQMNKADYQNPTLYPPSEHRHLFPIIGCDRIKVSNLTIASSGGDGLYISGHGGKAWSSDILIENVISDDNHRQGCSIISAENLTIRNSSFINTKGTPPAAGIDFEPNNGTQKLVNCLVENCLFQNNSGGGFGIGVNFTLCAPVSVTFRDCLVVDNPNLGISTWVGGDMAKRQTGEVFYENCTILQTTGIPIQFNNLRANGVTIHFKNCFVDNRKTGREAILINTQFPDDVDGLDFGIMNILMNENQPPLSIGALGPSKFCAPEGEVRLITPEGQTTRLDFTPAMNQYPGNKDMQSFASLPIDTKGLKPISTQGKPDNVLRLRGEHHFLQYAKPGQTIELAFSVPWHRDAPIDIPVEIRDSFNTFVDSFTLTSETQTYSFTPQYESVFSFNFKTIWTVNIASSAPGHGYDCSKRLGLMSCESDYYFHVPAGVTDIAVELWGDVGEKVQGTLYNHAGLPVCAVKPNFGVQFLHATRPADADDEIWKIHVQGDEDHTIRLGAPLKPILFTAPENVMK